MQQRVEWELVTDDHRLAELCERWRHATALALDTEFIRINTFYPIAGVIQVSDGSEVVLLDAVKLTQWESFAALLQNPAILKLLHSGSEDLVLFQHFFGCLPEPLFDTQKAAGFVGYGYSISYQNLVRELIGVELIKAETRSDWLKRPLQEEQCKYAALDVAYLHDIHMQLTSLLEAKNLLEPAKQEFAGMLEITRRIEDPANWAVIYLQMGAAWRLDARQLGALQLLSEWREIEARRRDKPRPWVARDSDLIAIAQALPDSREALKRIEGLTRSLYHQDADAMVSSVQRSEPVPDYVISAMDSQPLNPAQRQLLKKLQQGVRRVAAATGIAEELLGRKRQLIALLRLNQNNQDSSLRWPADMNLWQRQMLEPELAPVFQ